MNTEKKLIAVTGATGKQGGATIRELARNGGFRLRALTRKPEGNAAKALIALGAEVVRADLDDADSLARAVRGAWGVYSLENSWEAGVEKEEEQGKRLAQIAKAEGVDQFVYASVGSANKSTGIPHFENKFRVELVVKSLGFPSYAIIRPVFFMENLLSPMTLREDKLVGPLKPSTRVQMVAVADIGRFGAAAFLHAEKHHNAEVDIAGDEVTMVEAAGILGEAFGRPVTYTPIPIAAIRAQSADMALMFEWFERTGYSADISALERTWGIRPMSLRTWAKSLKQP